MEIRPQSAGPGVQSLETGAQGALPGEPGPPGAPLPQSPAEGPSAASTGRNRPVGLLMGSDSDWPIMRAAYDALRELGVGVEVAVASAHRTPERVQAWARSCAARGIRVIIAGAGGAAHLPGVLASWTLVPVIGVPIAHGPAEGGRPDGLLGGLDALLSIVQMPTGVPVACVGINAARNAALLAAQILALADAELAARLRALRERQARGVEEREQRLLASLSARPDTQDSPQAQGQAPGEGGPGAT